MYTGRYIMYSLSYLFTLTDCQWIRDIVIGQG